MVFPPDADVPTVTQACWDYFEPFIRARPELWLWNYKHWRYRPRDAAPETYPFYARWSERLDEVMEASERRRAKGAGKIGDGEKPDAKE